MVWRRKTYVLFPTSSMLQLKTCRTSSRAGGVVDTTMAGCVDDCPMTSSPVWLTWSELPRTCWPGWTGETNWHHSEHDTELDPEHDPELHPEHDPEHDPKHLHEYDSEHDLNTTLNMTWPPPWTWPWTPLWAWPWTPTHHLVSFWLHC